MKGISPSSICATLRSEISAINTVMAETGPDDYVIGLSEFFIQLDPEDGRHQPAPLSRATLLTPEKAHHEARYIHNKAGDIGRARSFHEAARHQIDKLECAINTIEGSLAEPLGPPLSNPHEMNPGA